MALVLSSRVRKALWWLILLLSSSNVVMLSLNALTYYQNETRESLLWTIRVYCLYYDSNKFLLRFSHVLATGYVILAALFSCIGLKLVSYTLVNGSLRFGAAATRISMRLSSVVGSATSYPALHRSKAPAVWRRLQRMTRHLYMVFGIHGEYFEVRLLLDTLVELTTQTICAHSSSQNVSNVALNQCFAVVIFLKCISGLVFRRAYRTSAVQQRVACLVSDVVLDFAWGVLLPLWSAMPLVRAYTTVVSIGSNIDFTVNSTREVERVLMVSWWRYLLSVIPFCTSFLSTLELLAILQEIVVPASATSVVAPSVPSMRSASLFGIAPIKPSLKRISSVVHALMGLYGTSILVVSLISNEFLGSFTPHPEYPCLHRVHPWFSTKEACIGRQINCSSLGISGSHREIEKALEAFDSSTLSDLFIYDCEALEIPSGIRRFTVLETFGVKRSTIVGWDDDAALTEGHFSGLKTLNLDSVSFATDASLDGLVRHEISSSVEWIHLSSVEDVAAKLLEPLYQQKLWQEILYFDCERSGLTVFPDIVLGMHRLVGLSLVENDMVFVSELWSSSGLLQVLRLDGNLRLRSLPDSAWHAAMTCEIVMVTSTNLSALPAWLPQAARPGFTIAAVDTPLCDAANPAQLSADLQALVSCDEINKDA